MKFLLLGLIFLLFSNNVFATVEICHRPAQILQGLVNHYWIKTNTKAAGMGSGNWDKEKIGDQFEAPYTTKVYIVDHSLQAASSCKTLSSGDVDEDCINAELDLGKYLGHFSLINNCQTFAFGIIKKCSILKPENLENNDDDNED